MYSPETIVLYNNWIWWSIKTAGDYNFLKDVPWRQKLDVRRYNLGLIRKPTGGYRYWLVGG